MIGISCSYSMKNKRPGTENVDSSSWTLISFKAGWVFLQPNKVCLMYLHIELFG